MALDAIIFDLDGTLVDTNRLHARAWSRSLQQFGYAIPEQRILLEIGKSGSVLVPSLLGEEVETAHGDALRDAHDEIYLDLLGEEDVSTFPGTAAVFDAAAEHGLRTAISTGSKKDAVQKVAKVAGFDLERADYVVSDDEVETGKPSPDAVTAAVEGLGLSPAQCVLIGDTPYDVEAGRKAGVVTLGVSTGAHDDEKLLRLGARAVYRDVGDLAEKLGEALTLASPGELHLSWEAMDDLMNAALTEARIGMNSGNLPVGAVIARGDGQIIASAHSTTETSHNFLQHAEMVAFQGVVGKVALQRRELVLVSTLEPCMMCLGAAMDARVDTIVYALDAPSNGGARRCAPMQSPGMVMPRIVSGIREAESRALFEEWQRMRPDTPFVEDLLARLSPAL